MKPLRAVCFDVDGVLLDSLAPHLQVCVDKAREYGLNLRVPEATEFKVLTRRGAKISPMDVMFETVGFPRPLAERANQEYAATFMRDYQPKPFPGVEVMLSALSQAGLKLGIVTANVRANVEQALGPGFRFFDPAVIFTKDGPASLSKAEALRAACQTLSLDPQECLYVGDLPGDWQAAQSAGTRFLGVTYGWGISSEERQFPTVTDVSGLRDHVLALPRN